MSEVSQHVTHTPATSHEAAPLPPLAATLTFLGGIILLRPHCIALRDTGTPNCEMILPREGRHAAPCPALPRPSTPRRGCPRRQPRVLVLPRAPGDDAIRGCFNVNAVITGLRGGLAVLKGLRDGVLAARGGMAKVGMTEGRSRLRNECNGEIAAGRPWRLSCAVSAEGLVRFCIALYFVLCSPWSCSLT